MTEKVVFQRLLCENKTKSKTKSLLYEKFQISPYLVENSNTRILKMTYSRVKTGEGDT